MLVQMLGSVNVFINIDMFQKGGLHIAGADLGLLAGGVSVSRSYMSFYLRTGGRER